MAKNNTTSGYKILLPSIFGLLTILFFIFIDTSVQASASEYITVGEFLEMLETAAEKAEPDSDGLEIRVKTNPQKTLKLGDALVLLIKAEEQLHGETVSKETAEFVLINRIEKGCSKKEKYKESLAKAYVLGLISGKKVSDYSDKRSFNLKAGCTKNSCRKMIERLLNPSKRYELSPDYQMLRIDKSSYPKLKDYYSYILDSYPNEYYDCMFNFMVHQATPGNAVDSELWNLRDCTSYLKKMTWDSAFKKLTYEDRKEILIDYDSNDRLAVYSAYMAPAEYDRFATERNERTGYLGMALNAEEKEIMAEAAENYVRKVLNVDYRTIEDDIEWQQFVLKNGISEDELSRYIAECKKDELIIECDYVAADISAIYYDRTPFTFKFSSGVVRVYAHFRVASDNGEGFPKGSLVINNGAGGQCLRNTQISEDGLRYECIPCNEMQNGFFDIGVNTVGIINVAVFDIVRYKGIFIEEFGYPCETPVYYPGAMTVDGIVDSMKKYKTREEYLEEWGYLY